MSKIDVSKTMKILGKKYPRSTTTLNTMRGNATPFEILISCLLSLRARDEASNSLTLSMEGSHTLYVDGSLCGWLNSSTIGWLSYAGGLATGGNFYE